MNAKSILTGTEKRRVAGLAAITEGPLYQRGKIYITAKLTAIHSKKENPHLQGQLFHPF